MTPLCQLGPKGSTQSNVWLCLILQALVASEATSGSTLNLDSRTNLAGSDRGLESRISSESKLSFQGTKNIFFFFFCIYTSSFQIKVQNGFFFEKYINTHPHEVKILIDWVFEGSDADHHHTIPQGSIKSLDTEVIKRKSTQMLWILTHPEPWTIIKNEPHKN